MRRLHPSRLGVIAALALAIAGCGAEITQETYDQIANGMSLSDVERILGGPGAEQFGMEISSSGLLGSTAEKPTSTQTFVWKNSTGRAEIVVTFRDGKVIDRAKSGF